MNEAGARGDATGEWSLRVTEQASILAGIGKIEEALQLLDVVTLYTSMQKLKEIDD